MEVHPSEAMLRDLIRHQIKNLFLLEAEEEQVLLDSLPAALKRTEFCFSFSQNKYYRRDGKAFFPYTIPANTAYSSTTSPEKYSPKHQCSVHWLTKSIS